jgi:hypothetical protein
VVAVARRRSAIAAERVAEGDGGLFLYTDGLSGVFDDDDAFPDVESARAAWQTVRAAIWAHPDRDTVFPPPGAVHDGLSSRVQRLGFVRGPGTVQRQRQVVIDAYRDDAVADLADVQQLRRERPTAARQVAAQLEEYDAALRRLLEVLEDGSPPTMEIWDGLFLRRRHGAAA